MRIHPLCLLISLCWMGTVQAQFSDDRVKNIPTEDDKKLNWGYLLGLNRYGFALEYEAGAGATDQVVVAEQTGFQVGIIGEYRLNNFSDLRLEPALVISSRTLVKKNPTYSQQAKSTYINLPVLMKVSTLRFANVKPYVVAGPSVSINLNSQENTEPDVNVLKTKTFNYGYELGIGVDLYMPYFKFSPSIRGVFGQSNELINNPLLPNVKGIYTRGVFLMLTFE